MARSASISRWLRGLTVTVVALTALLGAAVVALWLGLSDAQLGRWVQSALSAQLQGTFTLGRVHWQLPATLVLQDVRIDAPGDPNHNPTIVAQHAQADVGVTGLLHHSVLLQHVRLDGMQVLVQQSAADAPLNVAAAFAPKHPSPPAEPAGPAWQVRLEDVEIAQSRVDVQMPGLLLQADQLAVQHAEFWLDGDALGLSTALQTSLRLGPADAPQFAGPVSLHLGDGVLRLDSQDPNIAMQSLQLSTPGLALRTSGAWQGMQGQINADVEANPAALTVLPDSVRSLLQGTARAQVRLRSQQGSQDIDMRLQGNNLQVASIPVQSVNLATRITPVNAAVEVQHLIVQTGDGTITVDGSAHWTDAGVGAHALHVQVQDARVRRLLAQLTDTANLPEQLQADVRAEGAGLWPLDSTATVQVDATGIPVHNAPGLPTALHVQGAVQATPAHVRLTKVQIRGDGLDVALQGDVPLQPRAAFDVEATVAATGVVNRALNTLQVPVQVGGLALQARATGTLERPQVLGSLHADSVQTQGHTLQMHVPFALRQGVLQVNHAELSASLGEAEASVDAAVQLQDRRGWLADPTLQAQVRLDHATLNGLIPNLQGEAHASVQVRGSVRHPLLDATANVAHLQYDQATFASAKAHVSVTADGATLHQLSLQTDAGGMLDANGTAQWASHAIEAHADVRNVALPWLAALLHAGTLEGSLGAQAAVTGTWDAPQYRLDANVQRAAVQGHALQSLQAKAEGNLQTVRGEVHGRGQGTQLDALAEVRLDAQELRAQADGRLDVALVSALMPNIGTLSGAINVHLDADGPLKSPRPRGDVRMVQPLVWHPRGGVGDVHVRGLHVQLTPEAITLADARGTWGTGSFAAEGRLNLASLQPRGYRLHLRGDDLPLRTADLFVETNVNLDVTSDDLWPAIKGNVEITHGRYTKAFALHDFYFVATQPHTDLPLSQTSPWLSNVQLDVVATTAAPLAVKVDAGAFAVQTSLSTDLRITGNALRPHIGGSINAEGGTLHFPKADLGLETAMVSFVPDAHGVPVPTLDLHAQADVTATPASTSSAPQTYTVTMSLTGPMEKLALDLQASPGTFNRLEVLCLLATGHASLTELTQNGGTQDNRVDAALVFAGAQLSEPLTHFAEKRLERLLNTRIDLAAEVTSEQVKVTASKRITSRLRLEGGYQQAMGGADATTATAVTGRAQLLLTDQLMLEGGAQHDINATGAARIVDAPSSQLQLKWRVLGD